MSEKVDKKLGLKFEDKPDHVREAIAKRKEELLGKTSFDGPLAYLAQYETPGYKIRLVNNEKNMPAIFKRMGWEYILDDQKKMISVPVGNGMHGILMQIDEITHQALKSIHRDRVDETERKAKHQKSDQEGFITHAEIEDKRGK